MHHNEFLYSVANKKDMRILKLGHGSPVGESEKEFSRYDAVFEKNNKRIAVSTFMPTKDDRWFLRNTNEVITGLAASIAPENIDKLYLVFFEETEDSKTIEQMRQQLSLLKDSIASKIQVVVLPYAASASWPSENEL